MSFHKTAYAVTERADTLSSAEEQSYELLCTPRQSYKRESCFVGTCAFLPRISVKDGNVARNCTKEACIAYSQDRIVAKQA